MTDEILIRLIVTAEEISDNILDGCVYNEPFISLKDVDKYYIPKLRIRKAIEEVEKHYKVILHYGYRIVIPKEGWEKFKTSLLKEVK